MYLKTPTACSEQIIGLNVVLEWNLCFDLCILFFKALCVPFDTEQEHVDVRVQLIHPLQLGGIDSTKRFQDLELKTRIEYHPH